MNFSVKKFSMILILAFLVLFGGCGGEKLPAESEIEIPAESESEPEAEPEQVPVLCGIDTYLIILNEENSFNVGKNLSTDEYGRVSSIEQMYDISEFTYDENGFIVGVSTTDKDDGTIGTESWIYEGGKPFKNECNPNDGFRYSRITDFETNTDENGSVIELIENETFTDPEDGGVSYGVDRYEFEYDESGRVVFSKFYTDGKYDHYTVLTYDEYGNLLSYSNRDPETDREYLRVDFRYELIDETEVLFKELDPFAYYCNMLFSLNYIL